MKNSIGYRYAIIGIITILMVIPLFFSSDVVNSRANYSRSTTETLSQEWGGPQTLKGAILRLPVTTLTTKTKRVSVKDSATGAVRTNADGQVVYEEVQYKEPANASPLYVLPQNLTTNVTSTTQERQRGIFTVPVYTAQTTQVFNFDVADLARFLETDDTIEWDQAQLIIPLKQNKSIRGNTTLTIAERTVALEPRDAKPGLIAELGDPRDLGEFTLTLAFLGAQRLSATAPARNNSVTINSDWPHPSFDGNYLPDTREVTDTGFTANWTVPHFARPVPQVSRISQEEKLDELAQFGVKFFQPNNFYQRAYRAGRYGILFIALTFLTILLLDKNKNRPVHPIQYILIGLAQSMFVVLMVAFAEQIGFSKAYLLASVAVIGLITLFAYTGLKMGRRSWVIGGALVVLYAVLYAILGSADYALLLGSVLAFGAISATMLATRHQDWYEKTDKLANIGTPPNASDLKKKPK